MKRAKQQRQNIRLQNQQDTNTKDSKTMTQTLMKSSTRHNQIVGNDKSDYVQHASDMIQ